MLYSKDDYIRLYNFQRWIFCWSQCFAFTRKYTSAGCSLPYNACSPTLFQKIVVAQTHVLAVVFWLYCSYKRSAICLKSSDGKCRNDLMLQCFSPSFFVPQPFLSSFLLCFSSLLYKPHKTLTLFFRVLSAQYTRTAFCRFIFLSFLFKPHFFR